MTFYAKDVPRTVTVEWLVLVLALTILYAESTPSSVWSPLVRPAVSGALALAEIRPDRSYTSICFHRSCW